MSDAATNRRDFLKVIGCGLSAAVAPSAMIAQRTFTAELKAGGFAFPYDLMRFKVQNRFSETGRTVRTVSFTIRTVVQISGDNLKEWFQNNPLEQQIKPPPGFRLSANQFSVDGAGRELSAMLEMTEVPSEVPGILNCQIEG